MLLCFMNNVTECNLIYVNKLSLIQKYWNFKCNRSLRVLYWNWIRITEHELI